MLNTIITSIPFIRTVVDFKSDIQETQEIQKKLKSIGSNFTPLLYCWLDCMQIRTRSKYSCYVYTSAAVRCSPSADINCWKRALNRTSISHSLRPREHPQMTEELERGIVGHFLLAMCSWLLISIKPVAPLTSYCIFMNLMFIAANKTKQNIFFQWLSLFTMQYVWSNKMCQKKIQDLNFIWLKH